MTGDVRPRVLILGGGFAGVGAAQKLKDADAEVVLVDRHDYHTFQPLLYQLATGLLETTAVGHSLRDLLSRHENTVAPQGAGDRDRSRAANGRVRRDRADLLRLSRLRVSGPRSTSSARPVLPTTRSRCTRCRTRSTSRTTCSSAGRRPTATRACSRTVPSTSWSSAAGRPASRPPARWPSSIEATLRRTTPGVDPGGRPGDPRRGRAGALRDVQAEAARLRREGAHEAGRRGEDRRSRRRR